MRRILDGVKVLDFTRVIAGPYCTRMLADLGGDVIKVEHPSSLRGDTMARSGSASNNLGKRSIVVDLKHEDGAALARELATKVDVVIENFRPGVMERLGLGYPALSGANARLIYASISGFGQTGPFAHRRAYGATAHAESGWLWVQQQAVGSDAPFAPGVTVADIATGMNAFSTILAALYDRERTGRGQHVETTLMDSQLAMLSEVAGPALDGAAESDWEPFRHPVHAATDGHVTINIGDERGWKRLANAFGHEDAGRPANLKDANAMVAGWVAEHTTAEVADLLESTGAPYGTVMTMHEASAHPHYAARGMIAEVTGSDGAVTRAVGSPLRFSGADVTPTGPAPSPGADLHEVLAEFGIEESRVDALLSTGAVLKP
jgi:CoA:oxalate CoA-transferase